MQNPTHLELSNIGSIVWERAHEIFVELGAEDDFCVQHVGQNAVFGGTNRLIWSPLKGWFIDEHYCTPQFVNLWNELSPGDEF